MKSPGRCDRRTTKGQCLPTEYAAGIAFTTRFGARPSFALQHSHLIGLLIGELDQLPEKERKASKQAERDCLALWLRVLDKVGQGLDTAEAKITVCASSPWSTTRSAPAA